MKPLLVGMNNPYSTDSHFALYPSPENSAGFRLYLMLKEAGDRDGVRVTKEDYVNDFARTNLVNGYMYTREAVTFGRPRVLDLMRNRLTVICGAGTARDMKLIHYRFSLEKQIIGPYSYWVIPHPSGRTREYNDPEMRHRVGELLLSLYKEQV